MASLINAFTPNLLTISVRNWIFFLRFNEDLDSFECVKQLDLKSFETRPINNVQEKTQENSAERVQQDQNDPIVLCSSHSDDNKFLAVATSKKSLLVFDLASDQSDSGQPNIVACSDQPALHPTPIIRHLSKTPTAIHFAKNCTSILVSDRAGFLNEYAITETGLSEPKELLGHLSMLLDFSISFDGKLILTADRDEKIRVSRYPDSYIIEGFCLGHTSFVNAIACLDETHAISAGGDFDLRLWDFKTAKCIFNSPKICETPIRKLCTLKMQESTALTIIVLPDEQSAFQIFEYNPGEPQQPIKLARTVECVGGHEREKLSDFCVDQERGIVYAVGRNGIYQCQIGPSGTELRPIKVNVGEESEILWRNLDIARDKYPLDELYKLVAFGNVENYQNEQKKRVQKRPRKAAGDTD